MTTPDAKRIADKYIGRNGGAPEPAALIKSPEQLLDLANVLARELYLIRGYEVPEGYRFDRATHPHEVQAWRGARAAFELLRDTDLDNVIAELEEDGADD
jgi:hypothetical protein